MTYTLHAARIVFDISDGDSISPLLSLNTKKLLGRLFCTDTYNVVPAVDYTSEMCTDAHAMHARKHTPTQTHTLPDTLLLNLLGGGAVKETQRETELTLLWRKTVNTWTIKNVYYIKHKLCCIRSLRTKQWISTRCRHICTAKFEFHTLFLCFLAFKNGCFNVINHCSQTQELMQYLKQNKQRVLPGKVSTTAAIGFNFWSFRTHDTRQHKPERLQKTLANTPGLQCTQVCIYSTRDYGQQGSVC